MKMNERARNIAVPLLGVMAAVLLFRVGEWVEYLGFENPNPPFISRTGPLWAFLILAVPVGIGYFATRWPLLQSAVSCCAVSIILFVHTESAAHPGGHIYSREDIFRLLRDNLGCVAGACILAYVGTRLRAGANRESDPAISKFNRTWLLAVAEVIALTAFFYCAQVAKNLYLELAAFEFFNLDDLSAHFVEWHTFAREAFWALMALWLAAMVRAIDERVERKNRYQSYRCTPLQESL